MTTTTTIKVATDDEIKSYLQREIIDALQGQGNAITGLEQYVEAALDDIPEIDDREEIMSRVRRQIERADDAAADADWREALDAIYSINNELSWMLPGERGSRAHELQHELAAVIDAIMAARIPWGTEAWRSWSPYWGTRILTEQTRYQPWLREALEAWERGAAMTIQRGWLESKRGLYIELGHDAEA